jgi:hypothetical protein
MATVLTPESGPVAFEKASAVLREPTLSAAMARTERKKQAKPAERIAAAPDPLGRAGVLGKET